MQSNLSVHAYIIVSMMQRFSFQAMEHAMGKRVNVKTVLSIFFIEVIVTDLITHSLTISHILQVKGFLQYRLFNNECYFIAQRRNIVHFGTCINYVTGSLWVDPPPHTNPETSPLFSPRFNCEPL